MYNYKIYKDFSFANKIGSMRIYNGCQHNLNLFDFSNMRNNEYHVKKGDKCKITIPRMKDLQVRDARPIECGRVGRIDLDILSEEEYKLYDVIIISSRYYHVLKRSISNGVKYDEGFLDRLYLPVVVRDEENDIVGFKDVKKCFPAKSPYDYLDKILNEESPSLMSCYVSLMKFENGDFDDGYDYDGVLDEVLTIDEAAVLLKLVADGLNVNIHKAVKA